MKPKHYLQIAANFLAVAFLLTLLGAPFYFASQVSKPASVAGAKISKPFIIVSQIDKFPNLKLSQQADAYQISFEKMSPSQAFTSVVLITNITNKTQNFEIVKKSGNAIMFFGEDLNNQITRIVVPGGTSVPISLFSANGQTVQTVEFTVNVL